MAHPRVSPQTWSAPPATLAPPAARRRFQHPRPRPRPPPPPPTPAADRIPRPYPSRPCSHRGHSPHPNGRPPSLLQVGADRLRSAPRSALRNDPGYTASAPVAPLRSLHLGLWLGVSQMRVFDEPRKPCPGDGVPAAACVREPSIPYQSTVLVCRSCNARCPAASSAKTQRCLKRTRAACSTKLETPHVLGGAPDESPTAQGDSTQPRGAPRSWL